MTRYINFLSDFMAGNPGASKDGFRAELAREKSHVASGLSRKLQ
jgi:hypothetical protein